MPPMVIQGRKPRSKESITKGFGLGLAVLRISKSSISIVCWPVLRVITIGDSVGIWLKNADKSKMPTAST